MFAEGPKPSQSFSLSLIVQSWSCRTSHLISITTLTCVFASACPEHLTKSLSSSESRRHRSKACFPARSILAWFVLLFCSWGAVSVNYPKYIRLQNAVLDLAVTAIGLGGPTTLQPPCGRGSSIPWASVVGKGSCGPKSWETCSSLSSRRLGAGAPLGHGEGTGLSVWHCHRPSVSSGTGHGPSLDLDLLSFVKIWVLLRVRWELCGLCPRERDLLVCGHGSANSGFLLLCDK